MKKINVAKYIVLFGLLASIIEPVFGFSREDQIITNQVLKITSPVYFGIEDTKIDGQPVKLILENGKNYSQSFDPKSLMDPSGKFKFAGHKSESSKIVVKVGDSSIDFPFAPGMKKGTIVVDGNEYEIRLSVQKVVGKWMLYPDPEELSNPRLISEATAYLVGIEDVKKISNTDL